jgi:hypothetical protein
MLEAQSWVLAVMALFPERRDPEGRLSPIVSRPSHSARALELLHADGLLDANDIRRELVLLDTAARRVDPVWNLARSILLAARAHTAYLLPLDEAWAVALLNARLLQQRCRGWFSMAEACLTGLSNHHGEAAGNAARESFYALHAHPDSPWNRVPWQTHLPEQLPPPDTRAALIEVHDSPSLILALASGEPGQTIRLRPGHYRGPFIVGVPGLTLEGGPDVFLEGAPSGPILDIRAPTALHGLALRGANPSPLVVAEGDFLHVSDCHFESGGLALAWRGRYLQLRGCDLDASLELHSGHVVLFDNDLRAPSTALSVGPDCAFLRIDETRISGAFTVEPRESPLHLRTSKLELASSLDIHTGPTKALISDSRLDLGIRFEGREIHLERCQLGGTSHLDHCIAHLRDCHFLNSISGNLVLGAHQTTTCIGGQLAGVESPEHANILVLGGEIRLDSVALGPSSGSNIIVKNARLDFVNIAMSTAGADACVLEETTSSGTKLRIRGASKSGLVIHGGQHGLSEVDLAEIGGHGAIMDASAEVAIIGLGLRGLGGQALHIAEGARVLVRDLVAMHTSDASIFAAGEGSRVAIIAPQVELRAHVIKALLALGGARIPTSGIVAELAHIELEGGILAPAALALTGSELYLRKVEADAGALVLDGTSRLFRDEPAPPTTAISPLLVAPRRDPFIAWGFSGEVAELASVARVLARRLGYLERLGLRDTPQGLRVDGPLPVVARFAPALNALLQHPGALGLALAEALELGPPKVSE